MAVVTTVANVLVLIVISTTKDLYNSQSIYKLSLAAADLLVGIVVFPTYIYNVAQFFFHPLTTSKMRIVTGYKEINGTFTEMHKTVSISIDILQNLKEDVFPNSYINFVGVMTALSIFVSVVTLVAASFDRFFAVYKPFSYNKNKACRNAKVACVVSWLLAGLVSTLPVAFPSALSYSIHLLFFTRFAESNEDLFRWYEVLLLIPLILMWLVNIAIYVIIKKHTKNLQRNHPSISQRANNEVDKRLAITLCIIVGFFTFSTLPLLLITIFTNRNVHLETANKHEVVHIKFASIFLLLSNSFYNFFVYNARNNDFRNALKQTLKTTKKKFCSRVLN